MGNLINKLSGIRSKEYLPTKKKVSTLVALPDALRSQKSRQETLELAEISRDFTIDSGGRQNYLATTGRHSRYKTCTFESGKPIISGKTLNIHADHFAEAIELFKPVWIIGLDAPIKPSQNPAEQEWRFQESLDINTKLAADTIALREKNYPEVKVILPLQAQSIHHLQSYWRRIKSLNSDSVGLPMRCFKRDERLIEFLLSMHDLGIRDVHLLGSSRFGAICIGSYLTRNNFFNTISMDSGTWRLSADSGCFLIPYDLRQVHVDDRRRITEMTMKLSVSWQKKVKNVLAQVGGKEEHKALREFNYSAIDITMRDIERYAGSPSEMREFLFEKSTRTNDIVRIIEHLEIIALKASTLH